jgi:hypothetical protein
LPQRSGGQPGASDFADAEHSGSSIDRSRIRLQLAAGGKAFAGHPPGSTLCILRGLADLNFLLEIEAIAAV